jgi:two-component system, cell cycle response regulator CpdR
MAPNYPLLEDDAMPAALSKRAVLVVDDDDAVREFVRLALEQAGYAVVLACDGKAAHQHFIAAPQSFSLILSDVVMPNRSGPELVCAIRSIEPSIPVLFMSSGYTEIASADQTTVLLETPLIAKPFTLVDLLSAVANAITNG